MVLSKVLERDHLKGLVIHVCSAEKHPSASLSNMFINADLRAHLSLTPSESIFFKDSPRFITYILKSERLSTRSMVFVLGCMLKSSGEHYY